MDVFFLHFVVEQGGGRCFHVLLAAKYSGLYMRHICELDGSEARIASRSISSSKNDDLIFYKKDIPNICRLRVRKI